MGHNRLVRASPTLLIVVALGCSPGERSTRWEVVYAATVSPADVAYVRVQVDRLPCSEVQSDRVWYTDVRPGGSAASPVPPLPPGAYAFLAAGYGYDCLTMAEDCRDFTLPLPEGEILRLELLPYARPTPPESRCAPGFACVAGDCVSSPDGGP